MKPLRWLVIASCAHSTSVAQVSPELAPGAHVASYEGVTIAYEVRGHGPVCIAHPGIALDRTYLKSPVFDAHFTMVYFDPVGTGASGRLPAGEKYSIERDTRVLDSLRQHLGLDRVCLLGHGYGGWVDERYAVEHPDHVAALVLYATSPTTGPEWDDVVHAKLASLSTASWFGAAMEGVRDETLASDEQSYLRALGKEAPLFFPGWTEHRDAYVKALSGMHLSVEVMNHREGAPFDLRPELARVRVPTLVITGEQDILGGPVPSGWAARAIPGATLVVIPHTGAMPHIEAPALFDRALASFARGLTRD